MTPIETQKFKARKPREQKHDFKDGCGRVPARRHVNGKGWVAKTAVVEDSVYIGPKCAVYNSAHVSGRVRLEGNAKISGSAVVSGDVVIKQNAHVYGQAVVRDMAILHDDARITGRAHVTGRTRMFGHSLITGTAQVNACTLTGAVEISGSALVIRSHIHGGDSIGKATVQANAVVINSTIEGFVTVEGMAQLLSNSQLINRDRNGTQPILLTGNAIVADESRIYYPIEFREHCVVVRCRFSNYLMSSSTDQPRLRLITGMILHDRETRSYDDLSNLLDAIRNQTRQGGPNAYVSGNGTPVLSAVSATPVRQANFLETSSKPRRVVRLQEAGV